MGLTSYPDLPRAFLACSFLLQPLPRSSVSRTLAVLVERVATLSLLAIKPNNSYLALLSSSSVLTLSHANTPYFRDACILLGRLGSNQRGT